MAVYQSLTLSQISQNIQDNTSQVRILWESTQTGASHNDYSRTAYYDVYINGGQVTQYSVSYTLPQGTTKTIVDTTITVPHRNDGTGTITVNTWMDTRISAGVVKKSQTLTLSTIPRATTPVIAPLVMGQEGTITLDPASNDFTHTIIYNFGILDAKTNTLTVDTANAVERDNIKPITSSAVYAVVGNINALLATL